MSILKTVRADRARTLRAVADHIDAITVDDDETTFREALLAALEAGVQAKEIADRHQLQVSTVTRWKQGAVPHHVTRPLYLREISLLCRRRADALAPDAPSTLKAAA